MNMTTSADHPNIVEMRDHLVTDTDWIDQCKPRQRVNMKG